MVIVAACDGEMWGGPEQGRRPDVGEAAGKLAALLAEEHADPLLSYDPNGGNGHRDHVRVHQVGARAARLAGVRVAEAACGAEAGGAGGAPHADARPGTGARLFRVLLRAPLPVFRVACGTEWFVEPGGRTGELVARDRAAGPGRPD